jgi:hypothetical protein
MLKVICLHVILNFANNLKSGLSKNVRKVEILVGGFCIIKCVMVKQTTGSA